MKEFHVAAQAAVDDDAGEEKVLEFSVAGQDFVASIPTTGQIALVAGSAVEGELDVIGAVFAFLKAVLHDDGYRRLRQLVQDGVLPLELVFGGDEENPMGIVDWIVQAGLGDERPTQRSTDSSSSPRSGGPRSTGRSSGRGSIRSVSQPVAS